jgi:hypothetical protein
MKLSAVALLLALESASAFVPHTQSRSPTFLKGYLDDLIDPNAPDPDPDLVAESREATQMAPDQIDRAGPGSWDQFVDFDEFDGGDGQMGVAGDGKKELEKFDMSAMAKSKSMSAKNAWGKSTGYADELISKGVDTQRAQQMENWQNQQEVLASRKEQQKYMTDDYDKSDGDDNWRELAKFGVERNQDFDLDDTFGPVTPGDITATIELSTRLNGQASVHELAIKNQFMGFADFRAAFVPGTGTEWTIDPKEGSLTAKKETNFLLKFKAQNPGTSEGILVIETEDFKMTYKLIGSTA